MNHVPNNTPAIDPGGLKLCAKLSRRADVSGGPNCAISGFAAPTEIRAR